MINRTPDRRPRVLVLQQAVYPYRRKVFEELSSHVDLTVLFCVAAKAFRRWDTSEMLNNAPFTARVLPGLHIGKVVVSRGLLREFRRGRFDAVIFGTIDFITLPQLLLLLLVAHLMRIPVIDCEEFFPTPWYLSKRPVLSRAAIVVRRLIYRSCDAFVAWNGKARAFLVESGISEDRVFDGPHWYPPPEPQDEMPDPFPGRRFVLSIAYFLERKGLNVLIEAFRQLPHDVVLALVGSGEYEAELRAAAAGDERIVFLGQLDEAAKQPYLRHAYAFVLPTLWDPWGLVVNEAAYHGVPLVVTDAAGSAGALIDGNGFVVPAGDREALTEALATLLDDPDGRERMAERSREVAEECSLGAMVEPVLAALRCVGSSTASATPATATAR